MAKSAGAARTKKFVHKFILSSEIEKIEEISDKETLVIRDLHTPRESFKSAWKSYVVSYHVILAFVTEDQIKVESEIPGDGGSVRVQIEYC